MVPVTVIEPGIALTKVVDKPIVVSGTPVRWTMTASIAGDGTVYLAWLVAGTDSIKIQRYLP